MTNLERWLRDCELYDIIEVVNQVFVRARRRTKERSLENFLKETARWIGCGRAFARTQNSFAVVRDIHSDCIPNS